jgi:putative endonuclease
MPFYVVYILYSAKLRKTYVGMTSNLEARVMSHNIGLKGWTVRGRPWILIYSEQHSTKSYALKREKELKTGRGREFIKYILATYLGSV